MTDARSISRQGQLVAGKYRLERELGVGGMGSVWLGTHATLGTPVAVKFIHATHVHKDDARKRFEIEAHAASKLRTTNAVQVFDYGVEGESPYLVMEYLEGESLADKIERDGPMSLKETAQMISQACRALKVAHAENVIHRDIKPDNLFLATNVRDKPEGSVYVVKVVDFGVAKILFDEDVPMDERSRKMGGPTRAGVVIGTPNFMCPEQLMSGGDPDAQTDLWALAVCAFAAVTGQLPFDGDSLGDIVIKVCRDPLPIPTKISANANVAFDLWYARANHRDRRHRFQTVDEFSEALEIACGIATAKGTRDEDRVQFALKPHVSLGSPLREVHTSDSIEPPFARDHRLTMVLGLLVIAAGLGVYYLFTMARSGDAPETAPSAQSSASVAPIQRQPTPPKRK